MHFGGCRAISRSPGHSWRSPLRHLEAVELPTLEWVEWFNHRRLFEPIGDLTPIGKEDIYCQNREWAKVA